MESQNKEEEGRKLFLGMKYWGFFVGWVGISIGFINTIFLIWMTYLNINEIDINPKLHWMYEWFDNLVPVNILIVSIGMILMIMGFVHYANYYFKAAAYLDFKFSFQMDIHGPYKEMEQIAKEKKWI